jgi:hypothetical protein
LDENTPDWMSDWPSYSPDLNPIENVWSIISKKLCEKDYESLDALEKNMKVVIESLSSEDINNIILSMPDRLKAVIRAKGGNTKY